MKKQLLAINPIVFLIILAVICLCGWWSANANIYQFTYLWGDNAGYVGFGFFLAMIATSIISSADIDKGKKYTATAFTFVFFGLSVVASFMYSSTQYNQAVRSDTMYTAKMDMYNRKIASADSIRGIAGGITNTFRTQRTQLYSQADQLEQDANQYLEEADQVESSGGNVGVAFDDLAKLPFFPHNPEIVRIWVTFVIMVLVDLNLIYFSGILFPAIGLDAIKQQSNRRQTFDALNENEQQAAIDAYYRHKYGRGQQQLPQQFDEDSPILDEEEIQPTFWQRTKDYVNTRRNGKTSETLSASSSEDDFRVGSQDYVTQKQPENLDTIKLSGTPKPKPDQYQKPVGFAAPNATKSFRQVDLQQKNQPKYNLEDFTGIYDYVNFRFDHGKMINGTFQWCGKSPANDGLKDKITSEKGDFYHNTLKRWGLIKVRGTSTEPSVSRDEMIDFIQNELKRGEV